MQSLLNANSSKSRLVFHALFGSQWVPVGPTHSSDLRGGDGAVSLTMGMWHPTLPWQCVQSHVWLVTSPYTLQQPAAWWEGWSTSCLLVCSSCMCVVCFCPIQKLYQNLFSYTHCLNSFLSAFSGAYHSTLCYLLWQSTHQISWQKSK